MNTPQLESFELSFDKKALIVKPQSSFLLETEISFSGFIDWMIINNNMEDTTKNDDMGFVVLHSVRQFSNKTIKETLEAGESLDLVPCACRVHTYEQFYTNILKADHSGLYIDGAPINLISEFISEGDYVFEENEDHLADFAAEEAYLEFLQIQMI